MRPVLCYIGDTPVRAYSVLLIAGMIAGVVVLRASWQQAGLRREAVYGFCGGAILSALTGARIAFVMLHGTASSGASILLWQGGGEAAGGAIGALLIWTCVYSHLAHVRATDLFDSLAPPAALAEGIMRIGCLLNGCCYGQETSAGLGIYLPGADGYWAVRYPTQVLYSAVGIGLFALLWATRERKPFPGFVMLTYLLLYAASRLAIGPLRGDYDTAARSLSFAADAILLVAAIIVLTWRTWAARRRRAEGVA
ncbi:MAG: prolipoprotein diacylglyceryl transferase [Anaerolineae bacterium]|nr:prolipoprotein diacylglyceryl transferase [Anaerolineae bacterium]